MKPETPRYRSSGRHSFLTIGALTLATCVGAASAVSSEHMDLTPQQVFDSMRGSFQAAKAKGVHARYQWDLSGPQGGEWWIEVNDGTYKMGKGKISDPNVTFIATDKDWVAICQRPTQRHLGLFYRAAKGSRRPGEWPENLAKFSLRISLLPRS